MIWSPSRLITLFITVAGLLFTTNAHVGYNELESRSTIDDRSSAVNVPFQPSLRAFLEEAVVAYKRSLVAPELEEILEARNLDVTFFHSVQGAWVVPGLSPSTTEYLLSQEAIKKLPRLSRSKRWMLKYNGKRWSARNLGEAKYEPGKKIVVLEW
ncbi:hypothetical protein DFP72DRAFT_1180954 [Ephemerocybe angulata]|uniref:Uncharacterized protein n=1 Tax=Ephemerocybe angulata TaxID=980116 RepID=A0A8H6H7E7_9AGAR|nr:hypothetical protein DFP72DRAFT_1180954 [Tulosesus angulatus]